MTNISDISAKKSDPDEREKSRAKEEYNVIYKAFKRFMEEAEDSAESWEVFEDIVALRASFLIDRAITGLHMDFDKALELLRNKNTGLTSLEKQRREILVAAVDNLIDFAVAEEWQAVNEIGEFEEELEDGVEMGDEDAEGIFQKYNLTYAYQENIDVLYAAGIALWWTKTSNDSIITFMTQGDERVRDSHLALEGTSYLKSEYPQELIPPIEWACRCYLLSSGNESDVLAAMSKEKTKQITNPIFKESLAKAGRIFSDSHPYFNIPKDQHKRLKGIAKKLKSKFCI